MAESRKSLRKKAHELYRHATRVYHYRKDELKEDSLQHLVVGMALLKAFTKNKEEVDGEPIPDLKEMPSRISAFEAFLKKIGGRYYPRSSLVENIEMFLVAAIVAIGVRTYIIQPFQIPTNSMYPSYYGMTHQVYSQEDAPGMLTKALLTVDRAASFFQLKATHGGEVHLPIAYNQSNQSLLRFEPGKGRRLLVLPAPARTYPFLVGNEIVSLTVPADFDLGAVLREADMMNHPGATNLVERYGNYWLRTGIQANPGEPFLQFAIFAGDALFVDRFSYHFVRPQVGDPIVFRTGKIPGIATGESDKYYIKRMVGGPGDSLEIVSPVLFRNGQPITGNLAFLDNAGVVEPFTGYQNGGLLSRGSIFLVPQDMVFALGDNSANSSDSRVFGPIPRGEVIGRALFRYYPFSRLGVTP